MKKSLITLLLSLITIVLIFTLCACGDENGKESKRPSNELDEFECEHEEWVLVGSLEATCEMGGFKKLSCKSCGESKTITTRKTNCQYEVFWDFDYRVNGCPLFVLKCPINKFHDIKMNSHSKKQTIDNGCQEKKYTVRTYYFNYRGVEYSISENPVYAGENGSHKYEEIGATLIGKSCRNGVLVNKKCVYCGEEKQETVYRANEYSTRKTEIYDLTEYGIEKGIIEVETCLCGGCNASHSYVTKDLCQCSVRCALIDDLEGGKFYEETVLECETCPLVIKRTEKYMLNENGSKIMLLHSIIFYSGEEEIFSPPAYYNHYPEGHKTKYIYVSDGDFCGTYKIRVCEECDYKSVEQWIPEMHIREEREFNFKDYCGCDETVTIKGACPCGKYKEEWLFEDRLEALDRITHLIHNGHSYEEIDPSEILPDGMLACGYKKAYKFDCGLCYFDGLCKLDATDGFCYETIIIKFEDTILYERIGEDGLWWNDQLPDVENPWDDDMWEDMGYGRGLTDEEKQTIIDYCKDRLNSETLDLTEEERQKYLEIIDQLEKELGERQQ